MNASLRDVQRSYSSLIPPEWRLRIRFVLEVRHADAGQSIDAIRSEIEATEEIESDSGQIVAAGGREVGGVAAGGGVELAGAKFRRGSAAGQVALAQRGPQRMRLAANVVRHFLE